MPTFCTWQFWILCATDTFRSVSKKYWGSVPSPTYPITYFAIPWLHYPYVFAYNVCLVPNSSQSFLLQILHPLKTTFLPLPFPFPNQLYPVTSSTVLWQPSGLLSHTPFLQHSSLFFFLPNQPHCYSPLTISVTSLCYSCSLFTATVSFDPTLGSHFIYKKTLFSCCDLLHLNPNKAEQISLVLWLVFTVPVFSKCFDHTQLLTIYTNVDQLLLNKDWSECIQNHFSFLLWVACYVL